jgi:hypothetical protein
MCMSLPPTIPQLRGGTSATIVGLAMVICQVSDPFWVGAVHCG